MCGNHGFVEQRRLTLVSFVPVWHRPVSCWFPSWSWYYRWGSCLSCPNLNSMSGRELWMWCRLLQLFCFEHLTLRMHERRYRMASRSEYSLRCEDHVGRLSKVEMPSQTRSRSFEARWAVGASPQPIYMMHRPFHHRKDDNAFSKTSKYG